MRITGVIAAAVWCLALPWAASAQTPVRDGEWEISTEMVMPGMPVAMPPIKTKQCITKAQVSDPAAALPKAGDSDTACKVSDYKPVGNKVTWTMKCEGENPMSGNGEITYSGGTFDGWLKLTAGEGGDMTLKYTAKRLGDCTK